MEQSQTQTSNKQTVVWIFNAVVALLCLLSIACYFFGPVWQVNATYVLSAEDLQQMLPSDLGFELNPNEIIGPEGEPITVALSLGAGDLYGSFAADAQKTVDNIINANVNRIVGQLTPKVKTLAHKAVKSAAKGVVNKQVKDNVFKYLQNQDPSLTDEYMNDKLNQLGFTEEYVSEKIDKIIDTVFEGETDVDSLTEDLMAQVDDVYNDFQTKAAENPDLQEFVGMELSEQDRAQIEDTIKSELKNFADENGKIDADEILMDSLLQAFQKLQEGKSTPTAPIALLADETPNEESAEEKLVSGLKDIINQYLPQEAHGYILWGVRGAAILMTLTMVPWLYILIKLIVKLATKGTPTVKLALPIWLGWLFYLLLTALPAIAVWILTMPSMSGVLSNLLPVELMSRVGSFGLSVYSISWITAVSALLVFGISIFYMVMRRKIKKADHQKSDSDQEEELEEDIA